MDHADLPERYRASHSLDALDHLHMALKRLEASTADVREAVAAARVMKVPWAEIAETLGVTRQAAHERFGGTAKDELIRAWDAIERELWLLAEAEGMAGRPLEMLARLVEDEIIDEESSGAAARLFTARARAVHEPTFAISEAEADELTEVAVHLRPALWAFRTSQNA